ncbi:outer membrane lipoprotein carrier protein LolA [Chitinibacteraceae bacterium HSL-7]
MKALLLASLIALPAHAALLDDIAATLDPAPVRVGSFEQTRTVPGIAKPLQSSGHFALDRARGVVWQTEAPQSSTLIATRERLITIAADGTRSEKAAKRAPAAMLSAMLAGDFSQLDGFFNVSGKAGAHWTLTLTPRDIRLQQVIRSIAIDGGKTVTRAIITGTRGDVSDIRFGSVRALDALPADAASHFE